MSETALLFDPAELGEVSPPPTPRPSSTRRRLVVVEPRLALLPPAPPPDHSKTRWRQLHRERTGRVTLPLLPPEVPATTDHHEATGGACLRQQAVCRWRDCRHHLGGQRWFYATDDATTEALYSCVLAVARRHPEGLSPEAVARLLDTTESEVQAVEVYALKAVRDACHRELDEGNGGEMGRVAAEAFDALIDLDNLEPEPPPEYRVVR